MLLFFCWIGIWFTTLLIFVLCLILSLGPLFKNGTFLSLLITLLFSKEYLFSIGILVNLGWISLFIKVCWLEGIKPNPDLNGIAGIKLVGLGIKLLLFINCWFKFWFINKILLLAINWFLFNKFILKGWCNKTLLFISCELFTIG